MLALHGVAVLAVAGDAGGGLGAGRASDAGCILCSVQSCASLLRLPKGGGWQGYGAAATSCFLREETRLTVKTVHLDRRRLCFPVQFSPAGEVAIVSKAAVLMEGCA